jgi:hypothetical protein
MCKGLVSEDGLIHSRMSSVALSPKNLPPEQSVRRQGRGEQGYG